MRSLQIRPSAERKKKEYREIFRKTDRPQRPHFFFYSLLCANCAGTQPVLAVQRAPPLWFRMGYFQIRVFAHASRRNCSRNLTSTQSYDFRMEYFLPTLQSPPISSVLTDPLRPRKFGITNIHSRRAGRITPKHSQFNSPNLHPVWIGGSSARRPTERGKPQQRICSRAHVTWIARIRVASWSSNTCRLVDDILQKESRISELMEGIKLVLGKTL